MSYVKKVRTTEPSVTTTVRFKPDELDWLKQYAKSLGTDVSGLIRTAMRSALGVPTKSEFQACGFDELLLQLTGAARNLNQMTKAANAGKLIWDAGTARRVEEVAVETKAVAEAFFAYRRIALTRNLTAALAETKEIEGSNGWIVAEDGHA